MKVLLTTLNAKYIHSSIALRYLEKYCRGNEYEIQLEEYTINDNIEAITADIYKTRADVIAFSCYIWNITMTLEIAERIKKVKPDCIIIVGGPEVTYNASEVLESYKYIDYVVMGEGEETLKELLDYILTEAHKPADILGLAYRKLDGMAAVNADRPLCCDLNTLPRPYNEEDLKGLSGKIIYYETSRGCPFNCSYCLSSTIRGVRYFSMERVKSDLSLMIKNGVKQVKFVDRTFNADKKRAIEIFEYLVNHHGNTSFHFEIAADLLDDSLIEYLANVPKGLFQFEIGVQSTNEQAIAAVMRKTNFRRISENVRKLRQMDNIHLHLDLIAGLPEEDYLSFIKSFNDVYLLEPHVLQLGFLKLLKGSPIRKQTEKYRYIHTTVPPYEVLANRFISYADLLKLKGVEDVLEKYHNSGAFQKSLRYLIGHIYESPFALFDDLATYFEQKGLNKVSHSRLALYDILYAFYDNVIVKETEVFSQYLLFDLLLNHRGIKLPKWAKQSEVSMFKEKCYEFLKTEEYLQKYLPQYAAVPAKKVSKQVRFEIFNIDILGDMCNIVKKPSMILFDYDALKAYNITDDMDWGIS